MHTLSQAFGFFIPPLLAAVPVLVLGVIRVVDVGCEVIVLAEEGLPVPRGGLPVKVTVKLGLLGVAGGRRCQRGQVAANSGRRSVVVNVTGPGNREAGGAECNRDRSVGMGRSSRRNGIRADGSLSDAVLRDDGQQARARDIVARDSLSLGLRIRRSHRGKRARRRD